MSHYEQKFPIKDSFTRWYNKTCKIRDNVTLADLKAAQDWLTG